MIEAVEDRQNHVPAMAVGEAPDAGVIAGPERHSLADETSPLATWRFGWLAVLLLVAGAHAGVRYLAPLFPGTYNMYLVQPVLWLMPAAAAILLLRRNRSSMFRTAPDLLVLAVSVGLLTIATSFLAGILLGLGNSPYPHHATAILRNFWYIGAVLVGREIARWYLLNALRQRGELLSVGVTWLLFWLTSLPPAGYSRLLSADSAFLYIGKFLLPAAAIHLFATYLCLRGGPLASIAYLGILVGFEWFSPVLPDLMWPVAAMLGVLLPLIGLTLLESDGHLESEGGPVEDEGGISWSWLAASFLLVAVLWFNTGVFGVRPAIVHGTSMLPAMQTGDIAVTRDVEPSEVQVGEVIRFIQGSRVVLHRIIDITEENGEIVFIAQGDNNDAPDRPIPAELVEGELVLHIPHAGKPGIYFKQAITWIRG